SDRRSRGLVRFRPVRRSCHRARTGGNGAPTGPGDEPWHVPCSWATMGTLRSCDHIRHEHHLIGEVVAGIDALTRRRRGGDDVPTLPVTGAVDFFTGFVAGCHDLKEDEAFLPAAAACGALDGALLRVLREDHDEGGRLLGALRRLLSRNR